MNNQMSDEKLQQIKRAAYEEGMRDALYYLSDLYDGVEETDLWAEYVEGKTTEEDND